MIAECGSIRCAGDVHKYQLIVARDLRKAGDLEGWIAAAKRLDATRARVDAMLGPDLSPLEEAWRAYRRAIRAEPAGAVLAAHRRLIEALEAELGDEPDAAFMAAACSLQVREIEQGMRGAMGAAA